jgi:molecular chaperone DnaK
MSTCSTSHASTGSQNNASLLAQVRATDGDTRLGGEDIDARLVEHFLEVFKNQTGVDLGNAKESDKKKKALNKLRNACAQLKVDLSRMSMKSRAVILGCAI